jgi:hypothetical protein
VGVDVKCDANRGMSKSFAHNLWMDTLTEELSGVRMPEVVKADGRHSCPADEPTKLEENESGGQGVPSSRGQTRS